MWISSDCDPIVDEKESKYCVNGTDSVMVLGLFKCGEMAVVRLKHFEDDSRRWITNCSENWDATKYITHWCYLPNPPIDSTK